MAKELDIKEVIDWIVNHTDDQRAMDTISNLVFPNTTRYKNRYGHGSDSASGSGGD